MDNGCKYHEVLLQQVSFNTKDIEIINSQLDSVNDKPGLIARVDTVEKYVNNMHKLFWAVATAVTIGIITSVVANVAQYTIKSDIQTSIVQMQHSIDSFKRQQP